MNTWMVRLLIAATLLVGACDGPDVENGSATKPAPPDEVVDVETILAALEDAGQKVPALTADIEYGVDQRQTGDTEHRTGRIKYRRGDDDRPTGFYVGFDTLKLGDGPVLKDKVEYAFDGRWLTVAKERIKQMIRYEVAAEGVSADVFTLGKGPFPVPFGQEAAAMKDAFEMRTRPLREAEPEGTWYVHLTPKAEQEGPAFTRMEMWIDRQRHLPVRIVSEDKNRNVTTVVFSDIRTDVELGERDFHLPRRLGWDYTEHDAGGP